MKHCEVHKGIVDQEGESALANGVGEDGVVRRCKVDAFPAQKRQISVLITVEFTEDRGSPGNATVEDQRGV